MRILIVDNDELFADNLKMGLSQRYPLVEVSYGLEDATQKLRSIDFQFVLLDYHLGTHNGLQVFENCHYLNNKPKFILMTSYATKELAIQSLNLGINKFLEKPFWIKEVFELVNELTRVVDNRLILEPRDFSVFEKGNKISLTEIEYKILEFLIANMGVIVSKDELHKHVYAGDVKARNTLNTHITNLKNKSYLFSLSLTNIRGKGYLFNIELEP